MSNTAKNFVRNRNNPSAITDKRIAAICGYIIFCYQDLVSSSVTYSKAAIDSETKMTLEDYLKASLVDDFLVTSKQKYTVDSQVEEMLFQYETNKTYHDLTDIKRFDKIDICINRLGLQSVWNKQYEEQVYFAIECKVIDKLADNKKYNDDIQKFCDRRHSFRLPMEGMIAFISDASLTAKKVTDDVNSRLAACTTIHTYQLLRPAKFGGFTGAYKSSHRRNYMHGKRFGIHHLMLDYSTKILP
jgi:hypothetical protein